MEANPERCAVHRLGFRSGDLVICVLLVVWEAQALEMESLEARLLQSLGFPEP